MPGRPTAERNDPPLDRVQRWKIHLDTEHVHGPAEIPYEKDELVVLCLVRDGRPYVRSFIEHYRALGVKHIVFLDNGSTDGTVEAIKAYPQVTVLRTELPYKDYKYTMKQYLIRRFGSGRWSLYVDIDELFDYPRSDVVSLSSFLTYLSERSYTTVVAQMLDMFPEGQLSGHETGEDVDLKKSHRFYDLSNIKRNDYRRHPRIVGNEVSNEEIQTFNGGIRKTLFDVKTSLTKHPLTFLDGRIRPMQDSSHRSNYARVADITCVLYHYKFLEDFYEKAVRAVEEGSYFAGSSQYRRYREVLEENPGLEIKQETSRELEGVDDLVRAGFLVVSDEYAAHADAEEDRRVARALREDPQQLAGAFSGLRAKERRSAREAQRLRRTLQARDQELEKLRDRPPEPTEETRTLKAQNQRLASKNRELERQLRLIRESRSWRLLQALGRARNSLLGVLRKPGRKGG